MFRNRLIHSKAIATMLDIFDIIGLLTSNKLSRESILLINRKLLDLLTDRSGCVPPSECTITLHELVHM